MASLLFTLSREAHLNMIEGQVNQQEEEEEESEISPEQSSV